MKIWVMSDTHYLKCYQMIYIVGNSDNIAGDEHHEIDRIKVKNEILKNWINRYIRYEKTYVEHKLNNVAKGDTLNLIPSYKL